MTRLLIILAVVVSSLLCGVNSGAVNAHPLTKGESKNHDKVIGQATYLANEGVMIVSSEKKVVFDPFFHNDYGHYQLVPESIRNALFNGTAPYDNVTAVFISHAHEDHFSATDMHRFLKAQKNVRLYAPGQAVDKLSTLEVDKQISSRVVGINIDYGAKPFVANFAGIEVEAIRIPHAGGLGRRDIQNMAFRISLDKQVTVIHMGDADPNDEFFLPYDKFWQQRVTDVAFPPYWFFGSKQGIDILNHRINSRHAIGVHVAKRAIKQLKASPFEVFTIPGEVYQIKR